MDTFIRFGDLAHPRLGRSALRVERSIAGRRIGDREEEFPGFGGHGDTGAGGEAVLLEPVTGEAEVWGPGSRRFGRGCWGGRGW